MNYDVFTTAAVVAELTDKLQNGRVQDSLEIGNNAIGLEIYARQTRHYLLLSAHPTEARVHIVEDRVRRGVETHSPLGLMLRRYIEGAYLLQIRQPAWERVIVFDFEGEAGEFSLIAEPMERRSNLLLVRDGKVMDCMRRVGPRENRVRVSLPGQPYVPPPPQILKRPPTAITLALLSDLLDADPGKAAWRALTDKFLGFSPMLAKESLFRATQSITTKCGDTSARALLDTLNEVLTPLLDQRYQPGVTVVEERPTSYAAYPISYLPGWRGMDSISEALALYYGAPVGEEAYDEAKKPVQAVLDEAIERVAHRAGALHRAAKDSSELERLKQSGELLLAYQYTIKPGQLSFSAQYDFDLPPVEIKLDPSISPLDNAKDYFDKYERAKRAVAEVPALIAVADNELDWLRQLAVDLQLADSWPEIGEVQDALQANGYWRGPQTVRPKGGIAGPLKVTTPEGITIWVGRNARQNEEVTFTRGRPEDLWLHARGIPGAHVIIKSAGRPMAASVLQRAAGLAAYYSGGRSEGHVTVDVTERRHVHKIKGGKPGMVTYRNESPIEAIPEGETGM